MTPETLAMALNGREYGNEIRPTEEKAAQTAGLVVVFGASDDLVELRGALYDELGAYGGTSFRVTTAGLLGTWEEACAEGEAAAADYLRRKALPSSEIRARYGRCGWLIETELPHAAFEIFEEGERFCRGIVFRLEDAGK